MYLRDNDLVITAKEGKLLVKRKAKPQDFVAWATSKFDSNTDIHRVVAKDMTIVDGNIVFNEQVIFDLKVA
jgi:hypothetical protein